MTSWRLLQTDQSVTNPPPLQLFLSFSGRRSVVHLGLLRRLRALAFLLLLALSCHAEAKAAPATSRAAAELLASMRFEHLLTGSDHTHGIGAVLDIVQDETGYIWISGENGLAKYDAHSFKFYYADRQKPNTLADNWVADLTVDKTGVLWLATSNGLSRYNRITDDFTTFRSPGRSANGLGHNVVNALAVDADNNLYIGTGGGLSVFNAERTLFTNYAHDAADPQSLGSDAVVELLMDSKQRLWIGLSGGGLNRFVRETGSFLHWRHKPGDNTSLISDSVFRLGEDAHGRIWIGSDADGLSRMEADEQSFRNYVHGFGNPSTIGSNIIRDIHADVRGNLWIATDHGGLALYDEQADVFHNLRHQAYDSNSLISNQLRKIFEDRTGNLWIGGVPTGINFYDISKANIKTLTHRPDDNNSLSHNGVLCLLEDSDGLLWIGTENGLNAYDRATGRFTRYLANPTDPDSLRFGAVTSVVEDASGKLWVGTWSGGLHLFDKQTQTFKNYFPAASNSRSLVGPHVWSLARDSEGILWVGATQKGGLAQYAPKSDDFTNYRNNPADPHSLTYDYVWAVLPDSKGNLWIGTLNGLNRLDPHTGHFTHFYHRPDDPYSLSSSNVLAIIEDRQGYLWFGTEGGGLNMFDPATGQFRAFSVEQGLPSAHVATVVEDKAGNIWAGTSSGLARLDRATFEVKVLRKSDGLAGNIINRNASLVASNGDIYIGSTEGVSVFNPQDIESTTSPPRVVITDLRIFNQPVPVAEPGSPLQRAVDKTQELQLSYKDVMFAFDFAALSFNSSDQNRYAYMLEGFDRSWHDVGALRTATYTNIGPGEYTFRVRAKNSSGVWSKEDANIRITITPPPWRSWWAYSGYGLLLVFAVYLRREYVALRRQSRQYEVLSATDPLTGSLNRAGLMQLIDELSEHPAEGQELALIVFDIDHFKRVNDTRGHDAGDRILKEFADIVRANVRAQDKLARWGGEEFVLLCHCAPLEAACLVANKVRQAVAKHLFERDSSPFCLTISAGVAAFAPGEGFDQAFKRADVALYNAKTEGRNCVIAADEPT